jgi:RecB family exonuclease
MSVQRVFLNWDRPGLTAAVEYLVERFVSSGELNLANLVVVMPGARAGRRLLELLVQLADQRQWLFSPPLIVTVGKLPELLYQAKRPFANDLTQQLAWSEALRQTPAEHVERLLATLPADGDLMSWLSLGEMLGRLHRELAADGLNFADVAARCWQTATGRETQRWRALVAVQRKYLETLDALELWDLQTARLEAVKRKECHTESQIVLVGTVDLNQTQRSMLDQISGHVTALVFAPAELAERFDEHGCLRPEAWREAPIPVATEQIEVADSPADQAAAVVRTLVELDGRYCGEQITIGVPDRQVVPYVEQYLEQSAIASRYAAGLPISQTAPYRLIDVVAAYLDGRRFSAFAALVRHPSVHAWLSADEEICGDWLSELDRYYADHLPFQVGQQWLGDGRASASVKRVFQAVERLVGPLVGDPRPLDQWSQPIADLLVSVFGQEPLDETAEPDRTILAACGMIHDVLGEHLKIPPSLMPKISGGEALRLVQRRVEGEAISPPVRPGALELLGWLDLALDDAPVMIVTGFNEGKIPASLNADLFLPNQMRRALGIEDNDRRYTRDAYALTVLVQSRACLKLIVGRRASEGDPLSPSRLLFACDDPTIARRVMLCFSTEERATDALELPGALRPGQSVSQFVVPELPPLRMPVTSMRVTEFKDYLGCPYRYYLKHQLHLESLVDAADELDGALFGSLAHVVLSDFGQSRAAGSTDLEEIEACLSVGLDEAMKAFYGKWPLPAIRVQVEQLRSRLRAFARWQADWAREGWRIEHVETSPEDGKAALIVDGQPMYLRGRIDRIDVHRNGKRVIFDYKFSDRAMAPERTHRRKGEWVDLQLPLYRHLVAGLGITGPVDLGYIVLPKDTSRIGPILAEWSDADLGDADRTAEAVVRNVRAGNFPRSLIPPPFSEVFAAICQDGQFGGLASLDDDEGGFER